MDHAATLASLHKYYGKQTEIHGFLVSGALGVNLFFIISGFIIVISSLQVDSLLPRKSFSDFLIARFIRIIPLMWIAIFSYAALRLLGRDKDFIASPYLHAAFLLPFGEYAPNNIWTLRHELMFYLVFGISFLLVRRPFKLLFPLWIAISIALSVQLALSPGWNVPESLRNIFFAGNLLFVVGVLIGVLYLRHQEFFNNPDIAIVGFLQKWWVLVVLFAFSMVIGSVTVVNAKDIFSILLTLPLFAAMVLIAAFASNHVNHTLHYLGNASFSIYLFHPHVESALLGIFSKIFPSLPVPIVIATVGGVSVLAGCAIYSFVESPMIKLLHQRFQKSLPVRVN